MQGERQFQEPFFLGSQQSSPSFTPVEQSFIEARGEPTWGQPCMAPPRTDPTSVPIGGDSTTIRSRSKSSLQPRSLSSPFPIFERTDYLGTCFVPRCQSNIDVESADSRSVMTTLSEKRWKSQYPNGLGVALRRRIALWAESRRRKSKQRQPLKVIEPEEVASRTNLRQDYLRRLGIQHKQAATLPMRVPSQSALIADAKVGVQSSRQCQEEDDDQENLSPKRLGSRSRASFYLKDKKLQEDGGVTTCDTLATLTDQVDDVSQYSKSESASSGDNFSRATSPAEGDSPRRQDNFRAAFLQRLSYEKVWVPPVQRPPSHNTAIILDWDDTLLCTTFVGNADQMYPHPASKRALVQQRLDRVGHAATKLLELCKTLGQVFIVTNAAKGWVQTSGAQYIPEVLPALEGTHVISARHNWEEHFPSQVAEWKLQAFLDVHRQIGTQVVTNFVVIGDSVFEMEAARCLGELYPRAIVKKIKLRESPTPEELIQELGVVEEKLQTILECGKGMQFNFKQKESKVSRRAKNQL